MMRGQPEAELMPDMHEFPWCVILYYYPKDTPLRRLLLLHSSQVCGKALAILSAMPDRVLAESLDRKLVSSGAWLHDIGIYLCHAPGILCEGRAPYLAHGILGAKLLREYGRNFALDMEPFARIAERHTGSGITAREVQEQALPLPVQDYLPETPEEQLVCLADKFYSKSGNLQEKTLAKARRSLEKFGPDTLARFDVMCRTFGLIG